MHNSCPNTLKHFFNPLLVHILLIIILGFLAYSNTFSVPFQVDDTPNIVDNPLIKDFSFFTDPSKAQGMSLPKNAELAKETRYIGYLTFAVNHRLHGLSVRGYHIVNLYVHIMNALLVYALALLSFRTPFLRNTSLREHTGLIALFAALLFVSHPLQTQAVTYIVQRFTSLTTMFYLLSLVLYVRARLSDRATPASAFLYVFSLICAAMAMKTKEIAITLPVSVLLYEVFFLQETRRQRALLLAPLFITAFIIPLTLIDIDRPLGEVLSDVGDTVRQTGRISRSDYLFTQFRVITTYIRLLFLPVNQNLDYDYPVFHSFINTEVLSSFVLLSCIVALGVFLFYRSRKADPGIRLISFGIFWFFITLSVESSIFPIEDVIFEHRVYLPSAGAFAAVSAAAFMIISKFIDKRVRTAGIAICMSVIILLAITTYRRNFVWESVFSLWQDVVSKSPEKARGHLALGDVYYDNGQIEKAEEHFQTAVTVAPSNPLAFYTLGVFYKAEGFPDKAIECFERSISLGYKFSSEAYASLGALYKSKGMPGQAMEYYKQAVSLQSSNAAVYYNLGNLYMASGMVDEAIEQYRVSLRMDPADPDTHNNLGIAYKRKGLLSKAREHLETAKALKERRRQ